MSNCELINLPVLELEQHQVREVLRCVLHTIIFNRALGPVRPREVDSELFEITYVQCGDTLVERVIEEKIDQFYGWVEKHPGKRGQVSLAFFEKRKTQRWSLIGGKQEERLYWEQWHAKLQEAVEQVMTLIIRAVNEKKDHIPPVTSAAVLTFPFEITVAGRHDAQRHLMGVACCRRDGNIGYGLETMKRLLMHTSPPPVLS
ncbi:DUF1649-domain-containing protein [Coccomyxa subellipsoidea C-169]|uniref:Autophagy-related protein 101 n=1 Tax=Coccomyxa subellipsoidea (strain C-169) TaxID=574566 RepID=I0YMC9_COCSC|nr:DUF1649-domain-containing protein [Coccomyxa subellipsoidea C-169]EIE19548.1 DUF1649-domain-containing protein [Coccomyxa subellipsoidea C-169]|eukprot:XP_005644092.1 DUF1649-domain-containing protein [Coccomyxa subellipsoidea C-169]